MKVWKKNNSKEIVLEEDAQQYVFDQLGIDVTPKGFGGAYTQEQTDWIQETIDWYFTSNDFEEQQGNYNDEDDYWERNFEKYYKEVI